MSKVLVVDDDPAVRDSLKTILEAGSKHQVISAPAADEGLTMAKGQRPDLIILDISMPGMTGLELLDLLKREPVTCFIPVIMFTGIDTEESVANAMQNYAERYLVKPVENTDLKAAVEYVLAHRIS